MSALCSLKAPSVRVTYANRASRKLGTSFRRICAHRWVKGQIEYQIEYVAKRTPKDRHKLRSAVRANGNRNLKNMLASMIFFHNQYLLRNMYKTRLEVLRY